MHQGWRRQHPDQGAWHCSNHIRNRRKRDEGLAGAPPYEPEDVCLSGYRAHFFELMSNSAGKFAFRDGTDRSVVIPSGGPLFQLVGEELHDASENLGPLFAGAPPRTRVADGAWETVGTIVLGEEGRGTGKWRKAFRPNAANRGCDGNGMPLA